MFARRQLKTRRLGAKLATLVATTLAAGTLAVLPAAPALAAGSTYFTSFPPSTAYVGSYASFSFHGTAGGPFTGNSLVACWANFPDGNNWYYNLNGNWSSATCNYYNRYLPYVGSYTIQVGFDIYGGGYQSTTYTINVIPVPPYITSNPNNQNVTSGGYGTFYAYSGGNPAPSQQWQVSTDGGASFSDIPGAHGSGYNTPSTTMADNGNLYRAAFTNGGGTTWSNAASLTVQPRVASITTNPVDATTPTGTPTTFTAHANADPVASVQWYVSHNSGSTFTPATEASATSDTLTVTPSYADNGNLYKARFSNGGGNTYSNPAQLTVQASTPVVTEDPQAAHVVAGAPVTLSADATGDPTPSVQWEVSSNAGQSYSPIAGAVQRDYSFNPAFADDGNSYRAVFSSPGGSDTSAAAAVTVGPAAPTVASQTPAVTRTAGDPATFSVSPTGDPLPTSQWSVSTDGGATFTDIDGATGFDLTFTPTYAENGNIYQNTLTNAGGTVVSGPIPLTVAPSTPLVAQQPADHTVVAGSAISFTSSATGDPTATVQWQVSTDHGVSFADLADETGNTLSLTPAFTADGNQYRAVFTNVAGSAYSDPAQLNVTPRAPAVTTNPATAPTSTAGTPITLSAAAQGDPVPTVEWFVSHNGGTSFASTGVTTDDYTFTPGYGDSGSIYRAVYTNTGGADPTTDAVLTVTGSLPFVDTQPSAAAIDSGLTAEFSAHATSDPASTLQWQQSSDGASFADIDGETSGTLTTSVKHYADDNTWYRAKFNNVAGTTYSNAVQLTVHASRPTVTLSPTNQATLSGHAVTLSAASGGDPVPTVRWQRSANLGISFTDISGATSSDYTFTPSQADDQSLYQAVFSNPGGTDVTASATLSVSTSIAVVSQPTRHSDRGRHRHVHGGGDRQPHPDRAVAVEHRQRHRLHGPARSDERHAVLRRSTRSGQGPPARRLHEQHRVAGQQRRAADRVPEAGPGPVQQAG
jgi:hypothetical protein